MKLHDVNSRLGRRDFLRSAAVLGTGTTLVGLTGCSDGSPLAIDEVNNLEGGATWVRLDAATGSGLFISLDAVDEGSAKSADWHFEGHVILPTGEVAVLVGTLEGAYADAASMTSIEDDLFRILAPGRPEMNVRLAERTIQNAGVKVSVGQILAPLAADVVSFSITVPADQPTQPTTSLGVRYSKLELLKKILKWLLATGAAAEAIKAIRDLIRDLGGGCGSNSVSDADGIGGSIQAFGTAAPKVTLNVGYNGSCTVRGGCHNQGGGS
jgi:hypothetical protein